MRLEDRARLPLLVSRVPFSPVEVIYKNHSSSHIIGLVLLYFMNLVKQYSKRTKPIVVNYDRAKPILLDFYFYYPNRAKRKLSLTGVTTDPC